MALPLIRSVTDDLFTLQESVISVSEKEEFWSASFVESSGFAISGGFASSKNQARKIATAEYIERKQFLKIRNSNQLSKLWGCDYINTACGFAAGFNRRNVIYRSLGEAAERWVMSQWIDGGCRIERISHSQVEPELDAASKFFCSAFDEVWFFKKIVPVQFNHEYVLIEVGQSMGFKDGGIFPGSSAQNTGGNLWQHALLESYRHLIGYRNNRADINRFPTNKIHFFAKNASVAIAQIENATKVSWPTPVVKFHRNEAFNGGEYFIARTIIDGWESWQNGPLERFLY